MDGVWGGSIISLCDCFVPGGSFCGLLFVPAKMEVSELEQDIVCGTAKESGHAASIGGLLDNPSVTKIDALRLVMLYTLRYERSRSSSVRHVTDHARDLAYPHPQHRT